jgi:hypothetical protein
MIEFTQYNSVTHPKILAVGDYNNLLGHGLVKTSSWIIRKNGSYYEAIHGETGKISYGGSGNAGTVSGASADAVINAALAQGGKVVLMDAHYDLNAEITSGATYPTCLEGESKYGTVLHQNSTTANIIHARGKAEISNMYLLGSGWANSNKAVYIDGDEANACGNSNFADIEIYDCATGVHLEDNSWNNHFSRVYISKVKTGFRAARNTLAAISWNGENFVTDDCWISYSGLDRFDYGYQIDKANAVFICLGQIMNANYDGIWIKDFGAGLTVISNTQSDMNGRFGLRVENSSANGWIETVESFFKSYTTNAQVGGYTGCAVYLKNVQKSAIIGGQCETLLSDAETTDHHVIHIEDCDTIRVIGPRLYGTGNAGYGHALNIVDTTDSYFGGFHAQNVDQAVVESGSSDRNRIAPFGASGLNAAVNSVTLAGSDSHALYNDHLMSQRYSVKGEFAVGTNLFVKGTDLKIGASDKRALVDETAATTLHLGYDTDWTHILTHASVLFKVMGGAFQPEGGYKAADGTVGVTETMPSGSPIFKNGIYVGHT